MRTALPRALTCCLFLLAAAPVTAGTYYVDQATGDDLADGLAPATAVKTVTRGVQLLADGDTLHVAPGVYSPSTGETLPITIPTRTRLVGAGADATVLDGEGTASRVLDIAFYAETVEVQGVAIVGADGLSGVSAIHPTSLRLADCRIADNRGGIGGGLSIAVGQDTPGHVQIARCVFERNTASIGGALQFSQAGDGDYLLEIEDSRFVGNSATINIVGIQHNGGNTQALRIDRSTFLDNDGIAVGLTGTRIAPGSSRRITNALFAGNTGVAISSIEIPVDIVNATLVDNRSAAHLGAGSTLTNAIVWGNAANILGSGAQVSHSLVENLGLGGHVDGGGITSAPPRLTPTHRLAPDSPAIDRGLDSAADALGLTLDIDGQPRKRDALGLGRPEGVIDLGAAESALLFADGFEAP